MYNHANQTLRLGKGAIGPARWGGAGAFIFPGNQKEAPAKQVLLFLEATPRFELGVELLQSSALPLGYVAIWITGRADLPAIIFGAGDEARTRYLHLGKVALYQMSYTCKRRRLL